MLGSPIFGNSQLYGRDPNPFHGLEVSVAAPPDVVFDMEDTAI